MSRTLVAHLALLALAAHACTTNNYYTTNTVGDASAPPPLVSPPVDAAPIDAAPIDAAPLDAGLTDASRARDPLAAVAAAVAVADVAEWTDGPAWSPVESALYFTTPSGNGAVRRFFPSDGHVELVRQGTSPELAPVAVAILTSKVVTAERTRLRVAALDGGGAATSSPGGPGGLGDAGDAGVAFRWLRSVTTRNGYFSYLSDPGDGGDPAAPGRIFVECPDGSCGGEWRWIIDETWDGRRPTALASSSALVDAGYRMTIFAGYSASASSGPQVRAINEDSATGTYIYTSKKLFDLPDVPEGLALDEDENVYVAWSGGVDVYSPSGVRWGGHPGLAIAAPPTALAFGGTDRKTLYVTTRTGKIFATSVPIAGIAPEAF
jgi:hypothetical protein